MHRLVLTILFLCSTALYQQQGRCVRAYGFLDSSRDARSGTTGSCMLLLITISVLFIYTLLLIGFFMGWCTLIPTMFHPRKEIPFCSVKSPRRSTRYGDLESSISSSLSLEYAHRSFESPAKLDRRHSIYSVRPPPLNDYLHPKYSLPPMKIDIAEQQDYFEQCLRTPAHLCVKKISLPRLLPDNKSLQTAVIAHCDAMIV